MLFDSRQRRLFVACALVCAALTAVAPSFAGATPTSAPTSTVPTSAAVASVKEEEATARTALEQMKLDLQVQVAEYVDLGKQIDRAKAEIARVTLDLAEAEVELEDAEIALNDRANELYRGDRIDMLSMIFSSESLQDLWVRSNYLAKITQRDVGLINEVRLARQEMLWVQQGLYTKVDRLTALQRQADERRTQIETDLEVQEQRARRLAVDLARLMWKPGNGVSKAGFDPNTVIAEATFRNANAMNVEEIQTFLESQSGTLDTYQCQDYKGETKTAAQIIDEAAKGWGVNPKAILVVMQKEQSLLSRRSPTQSNYNWAMGCGRPDSGAVYTKYKGFGKQVWHGAEKLANNGKRWYPGITMKIDGSTIHPTNAATFSLYKYTPHFRGTMSFWLIYWRHFGDPTV